MPRFRGLYGAGSGVDCPPAGRGGCRMSDEIPMKKRPAGLGRGLSSLLGEVAQEAPISGGKGVQMLAVSDIEPHPDQPRRHFDDAALAELASSIQVRGLIQPIVVRPHG